MPLSSTLVWEVRPTGNAANGGAFRAGATGTDYSQQDAPQVSYTDLAVYATTITNVTSAANPFTAAHVGNLIKISSAAPWTPGYYEVMSVAGAVATLDRSPAAAGSPGGVGRLGGAADNPTTIMNAVVASNVVWVKSGTYSIAASAYFAATVNPAYNAPIGRICGYGTVRGDGVRATLTASSSAVTPVLRTASGWLLANFEIVANGAGEGTRTGTLCVVFNCKVSGATLYGFNAGNAQNVVYGNEATGCSGTTAILVGGNSSCVGNDVHDNTTTGISVSPNSFVEGNLVANNTGATSDGIAVIANALVVVLNNTVHGNGRHGLNVTGPNYIPCPIQNNIFSSNGGYGAVFNASAGTPAFPTSDGNAYYNNTSGNRSNGNDTTVNPQNASGPYAIALDRLLTADPFVNSAAGDFRLNATAGGGAACRGAGVPASWPGSAVVGYPDFGAAQHQDAGGGGGGTGTVATQLGGRGITLNG